MNAFHAPAALVALVLTAGQAAHAYDAIRCAKGLVSEDASKTELLGKCGEPTMKETRIEYETVSRGEKQTHKKGETSQKTEVVIQTVIDEWTYNFGPHDFLRTVVFINGRLANVRTGSYGF